jgi:arabinose-5-phosphate isomerase
MFFRTFRNSRASSSARFNPERNGNAPLQLLGLPFPLKQRGPAGTLSRMNHLAEAKKVFDIEIAALQAVRTHLDDTFAEAVELLVGTLKRRGKIIIVGIGKSGNVGQKIAATLTSTGSTAVVLNSVDALHGDLGIVNDGDLVITLSYSGESQELLDLLPALKRFSVKIIAFTASAKSSLARYSDLVLNVKVPKEACPFNLAPTSSTTAMLVMGDALAMAALQARGFRRQDYAKHHPSGAIGKALLLRVRDIMRGGARHAVAPQSISVTEALLVMTRAKAGSVTITDKRGKLAGVFTDGDLRRHLAADGAALSKALAEVMTKNPICIRDDALAVDALTIFNEKNIEDLIVVDSKRRPVGIIDLQDLPKLKLM